MNYINKNIGSSKMKEQPSKSLVFKMKDKSVKTKHLDDEVKERINRVDDLQNQIDSLTDPHGASISSIFGNDPLIGVSQKTLTEAFTKVWNKLDELSGEVTDDIELTVTPEYYIGEDGCTVNFSATSNGLSGIFEYIKFFANDVLVAEAENVPAFEGSTIINDNTVIKCEAKVMGKIHIKEKTVYHYSSFYLGASTQYSDIMDVEHLINIEGRIGGRYPITCADGDHIYIVMGEDFRTAFERADMNGFEIPFNETTQTIDDKVYVVLESVNTYIAGTYEININA